MVLHKLDSVKGYSFYQCQDAPEVKTQHCYCSEAHMLANVTVCLNTHYAETDLVPMPVNQVTLHNAVFAQKPACKVCGVTLTSVAYRFALTHATPIARLLDESTNDLGEWCCSLDHARQNAQTTLLSIA